MATKQKPTVVLGTIGHDAHMVGIWVLRRALEAEGFKVAYVGPISSQEEFIAAAVETKACSIWVSSMYGMAPLDCEGLREKCQESGLNDILLYLGGLLVADPQPWEVTEKTFKKMGFNRIYPPGTKPEKPITDLKKDLAAKSRQPA